MFDNDSDDYLLKQICYDDNTEAFQCLYNRYWKDMYIVAYARLEDRDDAKDCVQELFVHLWSNRKKININSTPKGYLFKALKNRIINVHRKKLQTENLLKTFFQEHTPSDPVDESMEVKLQTLESTLNQMPTKMRKVFMMSKLEKKSGIEIANELGIAHQSVRNQMSLALRRIKNTFKK